MAAVNKNKLLDNATKYIQKGQIDRAIKELQKVIEADPADVRTRLKLGDLYAKKNQNGEAAEQYTLVAESYSKDGFYLKAVAVYKQILKLDSSLIDVHLKLGDLYHQLGLLSDAMSQYQIVAQHYDQKGMAKESLDTLRKMVELDPENIQSRKKLAEIIAREGQTSEAIEEFRKIAEDLKAKGRLDDLAGVLERIVHLDQSNLEVVAELAGLYLERGDPKRALAKLQICFRANPHDLATLEMLSSAFVSLGQPEKAKSVYREIAKIHEGSGNTAGRMDAYRRILQIDPGDSEARSVVDGGGSRSAPAPDHSQGGGAPAPVPPPPRPAPAEPSSPAPTAAPARGGSAPGGDDPQTINKLLTEADVYLKYGLLEKALDHLRGIVRRNPQNVEAHLKLKDVYLQHKDAEGAVSELISVIELSIAAGDSARAAEALSEGLGISPGHARLTALQEQVEGGGAGAEADAGEMEISIDAGEDDDVVIESPESDLDQVEISVDGMDGLDSAGEAQIEIPDDAGVEIQVDAGAEDAIIEDEFARGADIEIADESVDVSVIDDVAIESPSGDDDDVEIVSDSEPDFAADSPGDDAEIVDLDSRRGDVAPGRLPEPSAITPDQLLNELANAFEGSGDSAKSASSDGEDFDVVVEDDAGDVVPEPPAAAKPSIEDRFGVGSDPEPRPKASDADSAPGLTDFSLDVEGGDPWEATPQEKAAESPAAFDAAPADRLSFDEAPMDLGTEDDVAVDEESVPPLKVRTGAAPSASAASGAGAGSDDPIPPEVAEDVDEADFFVKQEIYDEAVAVFKRLLKKHPGNGALTARLANATALLNGEEPVSAAPAPAARAPAPAPKAPAPAPKAPATAAPEEAPAAAAPPAQVATSPAPPTSGEETGAFDLAAELAAELEDLADDDDDAPTFDENEQVSVGDVLREFRKGVDKQVGTEDKQARYDLGIAYREMGLLDEAVGEFEIAAADPARKADCFNMMGICQRDKGDYAASLASFTECINAPGVDQKRQASYYYEMGATLEAKGDMGRALTTYQQVQALNPGFRDTAQKIRDLGGASAQNKKISFV